MMTPMGLGSAAVNVCQNPSLVSPEVWASTYAMACASQQTIPLTQPHTLFSSTDKGLLVLGAMVLVPLFLIFGGNK